MDNPKEYKTVKKSWYWLFNESHKEDFPCQCDNCKDDTPRSIIINEPIFEC